MILYHKSNLVYTVFFPQFLIFQQSNSAQTSVLIFFTSRCYYFFETLKIVEKNLRKLNCSYGKVSHILNFIFYFQEMFKFSKFLQLDRLYSNDIYGISQTYGIEAANRVIIKELKEVFQMYGIAVDWRHLSLIADYMTFDGSFQPMSRMGMENSASPLQQMTFESSLKVLQNSVLEGNFI